MKMRMDVWKDIVINNVGYTPIVFLANDTPFSTISMSVDLKYHLSPFIKKARVYTCQEMRFFKKLERREPVNDRTFKM